MFWIVTRQHMRLLARERVVWIALGLMVIAMAYGIGNGQLQLRRESDDQAAFTQRAREVVIRNQRLARAIEQKIADGVEPERIPPPFGSRHPVYVGTWCRQPALLPPSPLKWLATGQSDLYPAGFAGPEYGEVNQIGNPMKLLAGHWDLSFAVVYLLPLVILALGFDLVASERENGLLQMTLAQPVSASTVLLAKGAAVAAVVFGSVAALFASGLVLAWVDLDAGMLDRALTAGLSILLYAVFWLALSLGVNAMGRSATANALFLTTAWLALVVLVPFAIDRIAIGVYPVPPHAAVANVSRFAPEQVAHLPREPLVQAFLARHSGVNAPQLSGLGLLYLERAARKEEEQRRQQVEQDRWEQSLRSQQAMANRLAFLTPAALLTNTLIELAGTGRERYLDFLLQKRHFEQQYEAFFRPRRLALPNSIFRASDFTLIPTMSYREEAAGDVFSRAAPPLAGLAVISGCLSGCLLVKARLHRS